MMPLLKIGLNKNIPENYRPISNLNTISKIMERLALMRLSQHLVGSLSFNSAQSAYRRRHSTETALLRTTDFAHLTIDYGEATYVDIAQLISGIQHGCALDPSTPP